MFLICAFAISCYYTIGTFQKIYKGKFYGFPMELKDIMPESGFTFNGKDPEKPTDSFAESEISDIGKVKVESLKEAILDIKKLIVGRKSLSQDIFNSAEKLKTEINNFLIENSSLKTDDPMESRDVAKQKNDLRYKKIEVAELQINEKVSSWKDIALLKRELREYQRQLSEKESRMDMLKGILEDEE